MNKMYIRLAWRSLQKNKAFAIINVLGLALGLATCLPILLYVIDELSYDRISPDANRIYRVNADIKFGGNASSYAITPPPLAAALLGNYPEVQQVVRLYHDFGLRLKKGDENIQEEKIIYADPGIFKFFNLPMLAGNARSALTEPNTVVITESTAKRYFKSVQAAIGQTLLAEDQLNLKVTGVISDLPSQLHFNYDFFISFATRPEYKITNWFSYNVNTYVLLKPNANAQTLQSKFPALIRRETEAQSAQMNMNSFEKMGNYFRYNLIALKDIHLKSNRQFELAANGSITYVYILLVVAVFILLVACINFMNLATARSAKRAREVGVRKVLGSSKMHLIFQFLSESFILTSIASIIALLLAWMALPWFNQLSGKQFTVGLNSLLTVLPVFTVMILLVSVLAGAYPAFFLSSFKPAVVLKGALYSSFKKNHLRSSLVVFQFAVSIFLIVSTLFIYHQLKYIQNKNLGFNRNQVLVINHTNILGTKARLLQQRIKQLTGVTDATLSSFLPVGGNRNPDAVFSSPKVDPKSALYTEIWYVDEHYLNTMGMTLTAGRNFANNMQTDSSGVIINQAAARMLGITINPMRQKLYRPSTGGVKIYEVLGVVNDFNFNTLRDNITPVIMMLQEDTGAISVRINSGNLPTLLTQITQAWKDLAPNQHLDYAFMNESFETVYRSEQRLGKLFMSFAALAIIIACLGLLGLAAYAAEQRTKEIGIRKVLGASVSNVVVLLSKDFMRLILIAILFALPISWVCMQKWLNGFAYRQMVPWYMLMLGIGGVLVSALLVISAQSVKAALTNPISGLKRE
ncbi:ABC transporter permease [Mucilaginibacter sp. CSA2-8R]|uniref:ABC transporter permease n=1 Tax=Mucilaginibacter sp. CSA2-8R TaxID=3141542 RepID=UPI00315C8115